MEEHSNTASGAALSKGEYIWRANGVCLEECVAERALGLPPLPDPLKAEDADMPAVARYGDGLVPALQKKQAGLRALGIPDVSEERKLITEALRHFEATVAAFEQARAAAHRTDSAAFRHHWLVGRQHDFVA